MSTSAHRASAPFQNHIGFPSVTHACSLKEGMAPLTEDTCPGRPPADHTGSLCFLASAQILAAGSLSVPELTQGGLPGGQGSAELSRGAKDLRGIWGSVLPRPGRELPKPAGSPAGPRTSRQEGRELNIQTRLGHGRPRRSSRLKQPFSTWASVSPPVQWRH